VAASVRGTSHERTGQECQDAHRWQVVGERLILAAIADGAGSASLGGLGAETAARAALESLAGCGGDASTGVQLWKRHLAAALVAARDAVLEQAAVRGETPRELASTLILVVATPELAAAAQIGDGAALLKSDSGELISLTRPPSDEYINQTTFLISDDGVATAQVGAWEGSVQAVAVLTDGLQRLALQMPEGAPHAPFFAPLFRFIAETPDLAQANEQLVTFLQSPRITERADDDLTLLLAASVWKDEGGRMKDESGSP
jgi:hypothetical protein